MNGITKALLILLVLGLFVAGGAGLIAMQFLETPASDSSDAVVFEVKPGDTFKSVARRLEDQSLVSSALMLEIYARAVRQAGKIRVGEYSIRRDSRPKEVLALVTSGRSLQYSITIPEGYNRFEIGDVLERQGFIKKQEFLALTQDPKFILELLGEERTTLEGYLYPETYAITKFTTARTLIRAMVDRFRENYSKLVIPAGLNLSRHELVTLASIVEKETGAPEERGVISSVFHNRMRLKMRLQTDPTVIYGIWEQTGFWNGRITRNDLTTPTRYNTYTLNGLPYGPIANPGLLALQAAAKPDESDFLFFVSRNDGTHVFSQTYEQHKRAVADYQLNRKAREGKSWRDLQKREAVPDTVISAPPLKKAPSATKP
jgi:UPF0755 protein